MIDVALNLQHLTKNEKEKSRKDAIGTNMKL